MLFAQRHGRECRISQTGCAFVPSGNRMAIGWSLGKGFFVNFVHMTSRLLSTLDCPVGFKSSLARLSDVMSTDRILRTFQQSGFQYAQKPYRISALGNAAGVTHYAHVIVT